MTPRKITGNNAIIHWQDGSIWETAACMRSWELTTLAEMGETSTKQSGAYRTYRGIKNTWQIGMAGLETFDKQITIPRFRQAQKVWREVFITVSITDGDLNTTYQGRVLITSIGNSKNYSTALEYTIEATGTGELFITDVPFDPNDQKVGGLFMVEPYYPIGGEWNTGPDPVLVGMHVPVASRDGANYEKIDLLTGVFNINRKEFKFDETTGEVFFNTELPPLQPDEQVLIFYQKK